MAKKVANATQATYGKSSTAAKRDIGQTKIIIAIVVAFKITISIIDANI